MRNRPTRRMTKQRKKILDVLKSTKFHPTADWVYAQVKQEIPNISLGTVYRNLSVLQELGEIIELNYGSSYSRYDANSETHYHFTCLDCGQVVDVDIDVDKGLEEEVANFIGGKVSYSRTEFFGYCSKCSQ